MADLIKRYSLARRSHQRECADLGGIQPLPPSAASHHLHRADVLAHPRHGDAREQELQLLRRIGGAQADGAQPVLIQHEMQRGRALAPVGVDLPHRRIFLHHLTHLLRDLAHGVFLRPRHAKRHRERRIRSEHQLRHPHPRLRRKLIGHRLARAKLERVAVLLAAGQHNDLGE
ncbi:hypothetical protein D3C73_1213240 [compost metagenome]